MCIYFCLFAKVIRTLQYFVPLQPHTAVYSIGTVSDDERKMMHIQKCSTNKILHLHIAFLSSNFLEPHFASTVSAIFLFFFFFFFDAYLYHLYTGQLWVMHSTNLPLWKNRKKRAGCWKPVEVPVHIGQTMGNTAEKWKYINSFRTYAKFNVWVGAKSTLENYPKHFTPTESWSRRRILAGHQGPDLQRCWPLGWGQIW